jgi:hypothetical protein
MRGRRSFGVAGSGSDRSQAASAELDGDSWVLNEEIVRAQSGGARRPIQRPIEIENPIEEAFGDCPCGRDIGR